MVLCAATMGVPATSDLPQLAYVRPRTVDEARAALAAPRARAYAGGTDLLPALFARRPWTERIGTLVDVKALAATRGIDDRGARLRIGAVVTAAELAASAVVRRAAPVLAEAALATASPAVRHRGTVGGNVVTPHPAGDVVTALLALDAAVELADDDGTHELPLAALLAALHADTWPRTRLLLAVQVARRPRSAFAKLGTRRGFGRALVAAAVALDGARPTVALGGLHGRPFVAAAVGAALAADAPLAPALGAECRPPVHDELPSVAYRLRAAAVVIARARARADRA